MNRLFATRFPETANELVRRGERKLDSVLADEEDYMTARDMTAVTAGDEIDDHSTESSGGSEAFGFMSNALTPFSFEHGQASLSDSLDDFLAINLNLPLLSPFAGGQVGASCPGLNETNMMDGSLGCCGGGDMPELGIPSGEWDTSWGANAVGHVRAEPDPAKKQRSALDMEGEHSRQGGEAGHDKDDTSTSVSRVRQRLNDLEGSLQAHVKEQLLQLGGARPLSWPDMFKDQGQVPESN